MSYYNTNKESGHELEKSNTKAKKQEDHIMDIYNKHLDCYSASQLYLMIKREWPLTSVRRALTNLTYDGKLVKTNDKIMGLYGKREHKYKKI